MKKVLLKNSDAAKELNIYSNTLNQILQYSLVI